MYVDEIGGKMGDWDGKIMSNLCGNDDKNLFGTCADPQHEFTCTCLMEAEQHNSCIRNSPQSI